MKTYLLLVLLPFISQLYAQNTYVQMDVLKERFTAIKDSDRTTFYKLSDLISQNKQVFENDTCLNSFYNQNWFGPYAYTGFFDKLRILNKADAQFNGFEYLVKIMFIYKNNNITMQFSYP